MRRRLILAAAIAAIGCDGDSKSKGSSGGAPVDRYMAKSKATEAVTMVRKMAMAAKSYYLEMHIAKGSISPVPPQFPPAVGPTPKPGSCCAGDGGKCTPEASDWAAPGWKALDFALADPYRYSYQFIPSAGDGGFTARAIGDLDCDGTFSTFELSGTVASEDDVELGPLTKTRELE